MSSVSMTRREQLKAVLSNICSIRTPEAVAAATKKAEESIRVIAYKTEYEKAQKFTEKMRAFHDSMAEEAELISDSIKAIIKDTQSSSTFNINIHTYGDPSELTTQVRGNEVIIGVNLSKEDGQYHGGHELILVSEPIQDPLRTKLDLIKAGALDEMELCTTEKQIIELIRDVKEEVNELKK